MLKEVSLLNVATLGKALPQQAHSGGDENDNDSYTCHNSDDDGNCVVGIL